ncbi:MAG: hypothetical protein ACPKQO_09680 [Nitrososphaeraceae archaeon]
MKFEYEEFSSIEDILSYMVSVAPYMKQLLPLTCYKGYIFSLVPITQFSSDVLMMIYTKKDIKEGMIEFDIATRIYKNVSEMNRADKNYFIILKPKSTTLADEAIKRLENNTTK